MSKGLEALQDIKSKPFSWEKLKNSLDTIEKELKRLEELEKAFDTLSKEDEKTKKLLSLEIEKNRALEIIKEKLSPLARFTFLPMTQEEFELVEEILKWN